MTRLGALVGIALMMVGACGLGMPERTEWIYLLPAVAGAIIGVASVAAMYSPAAKAGLDYTCAAASLLLLVFSALRIYPDVATFRRGGVPLIADVDVLALAAVFLYIPLTKILKDHLAKKPKAKA